MDLDEALKLLRRGEDGVKEWNRRRKAREEIPGLQWADLSRPDLSGPNLSEADLSGADLRKADFSGANLHNANVRASHLGWADLSKASLSLADLRGAILHCADLSGAQLCNAYLGGADLSEAVAFGTSFCSVDLSKTKGLKTIHHTSRNYVDVHTLTGSKGRIPEEFLRGCGFVPWQVLEARMYDPNLTAAEISDLQYKIFDLRAKGPIFLGGVFISYAHEDAKFVDKMHDRLKKDSAPVWLDRHDAVAGPIKKQVMEALRLNDVVLLVLSKDSIDSDWVAHELKTARRREKEEERDILCPVALDDSWEAKCRDDPEWGHLKDKLILDFAKWKTKAFEGQYQKLIKGLKIHYPPIGKSDTPDAAAT